MMRYGVARQTVQNALDLWRVEGLVIGQPGAGWFVRERPVVHRLARSRLSRDERSQGRGTFVTDSTEDGWAPTVQVTVRRSSPVLAITRTAYDTNGTPVETNDMVLAADRYELIYELPAN